MDSKASYKFTFISRKEADGEREYTEHTRTVPLSELMHRYDQAWHWLQTSKHASSVLLVGPKVSQSHLWEGLRAYIVKHLFENEELFTGGDQEKVIGLVWLTLSGSGDYTLNKVIETQEQWEGFEEPVTVHRLKPIDAKNVDKAFRWAAQKGWRDFGIWHRDYPGLILAADDRPVQEALADIPEIAKHLETGKVERATCKKTRNEDTSWTPRIKTTRTMQKIQALRRKYPNTALDLAYAPLEILIRRYGFSMDRAMAPAVPVA